MPVSEAGPLVFNQVINRPSSEGIANLALTSGIAQKVDVPYGTRSCMFAFNADYWVTFGTTAVSQTFSSYSSAGSTLAMVFNPEMRYIGAATTALSIYSDWTCKGSVSFYK